MTSLFAIKCGSRSMLTTAADRMAKPRPTTHRPQGFGEFTCRMGKSQQGYRFRGQQPNLCWQAFRLSAVIAAQSGGTKPPDWLRQTSAQGSVGRTGGYRQTKNSRQLEQSSYCLNKRCYRTDNWRDQTGFLDFRAPTVVKREERVWERGVAPL